MAVIYQYISVQTMECTAPRVNLKVNSGLWVLMMCQCRFTNCNKCTTLVRSVDNGGDCTYRGQGADGKCLYLVLNFA